MAIQLRLGVTPESLQAKASDVEADITAMEADVKNLTSQIDETGGYWKGEAGDLQRKQYYEHLEELNQMFERLRTYPTRILQMAGIYQAVEDSNVQIAASTTTDIVMS